MVNVFKYFGQNTCRVFCILTTKYNRNSHAVPLLGLCNARSQCTKYVTAQNAFRQWILFREAEK